MTLAVWLMSTVLLAATPAAAPRSVDRYQPQQQQQRPMRFPRGAGVFIGLAIGSYFGARRLAAHCREQSRRVEKLEAERAADIGRAGPPRFNG